MVKPAFTFETKNISDLLDEMREKSLSIVIVLDEYGAAAGLITMEDILEEIVGDIRDEYEGRDAPEITELTRSLTPSAEVLPVIVPLKRRAGRSFLSPPAASDSPIARWVSWTSSGMLTAMA